MADQPIPHDRIQRLLVAKKLEIATDEELRELDRLLSERLDMQKTANALDEDKNLTKKYYAHLWSKGTEEKEQSQTAGKIYFRKWAYTAAATVMFLSGTALFLQNRDALLSEKMSAQNDAPQSVSITFLAEEPGEPETLDLRKTVALNSLPTQARKETHRDRQIKGLEAQEETEALESGVSDFRVILEDGTEVHLGYDSKLIFPKHFSGSKREVTLVGEAFVKVAKSEKPFFIRTPNGTIRQYGTSFHVSAPVGRQRPKSCS